MSSDKARGWTPEEVIRLRQMVADYATAPELAAAFDRTTSAIYQKLSSLGLKIKRRPEPEPHEWGGTHEIKPRVTVERAVPVSKPLEPAAPPASPGLPTCNDAAHKAGHNAPPASLLDGIADRIRAISVELVNDPKSPRGWRLFGQVQALISILRDEEAKK